MFDEIMRLGGYAYLASPYTLYHLGLDTAHCDICEIAGKLLKRGIVSFSPIAHSHPIAYFADIDPVDHKIWLAANQPMMDAASCLIVATLKGWKESFGVIHEIAEFKKADKPIFLLESTKFILRDYR